MAGVLSALLLVHVATSVAMCESRDTKGLYALAGQVS